jgi:hypothetical protein
MHLTDKFAELRVRAGNAVNRLLESVPPQKRRPTFIITAGILAVLLVIFSMTKLRSASDTPDVPAVREAVVRPGIIPTEDIFLPDEPDFVPGVLLEREQLSEWTTDDAAVWWQDPLKNGEEQWRNSIEETIDGIMESVP